MDEPGAQLSIRKHCVSFIGFCLTFVLAPQNLVILLLQQLSDNASIMEVCDVCQRKLSLWEAWRSQRGPMIGIRVLKICPKCQHKSFKNR